ncbi:hypothetical protein PHYC_00373 [Phycisphaerales bacterium]|nr:hypothetical protein PHYC_00373 [Phycisphaerales bacterium]
MNRPVFTIMLGAIGLIAGCAATPGRGPYESSAPADRHSTRADDLNREAVAVIETDPAKAERLLREALSADLFHGPAHNNLGTLLLAKGRLYEASEEFTWGSKLLPGHPDPRMNLALTLELAGRSDDAISTYRTALEVYPEHIPTLQALTRLQIRVGRLDANTASNLATISLRGESEEWRGWARLELARRDR